MGTCCYAFDQHWILFPSNIRSTWHLDLIFTVNLSQWRTQGRPKCAKNVLKWRTFVLTGWITGKRLKIDGYMLRCVWQALNPLSIHVTLTAIVSGAYPGEAKMCLRLIAETDARSVVYNLARRRHVSSLTCMQDKVKFMWCHLSEFAVNSFSC